MTWRIFSVGVVVFWEQQIQHATATDVGLRRQNNEDANAVHFCTDFEDWQRRGHILVVADGMGGHAVGELASRLAVEAVPHSFLKSLEGSPQSALKRAVEEANRTIFTRGTQNQDFLNMGTTCTALVLNHAGALIAHVGDSRVYRVRRDRIDQLTADHSLIWELMSKRPGLLDKSEMLQNKNVITRSLGPEEQVQVDLEGPHPVAPGDLYVVCSDGLSNQLTDEEIGGIVRELPVKHAARMMVHLANARGGPDNITVILASIGDLPANVQPEPVMDYQPPEEGPSWSWLISFWAGIGLLVLGLAMLLRGFTAGGVAVTVVAVAALGGSVLVAARSRRQLDQNANPASSTNLSRVYRTAVCLGSKKLYTLLVDVGADILRTAKEEDWPVRWSEYDQAIEAAHRDALSKRYSKATRHLARGVDMLMSARPGHSQLRPTAHRVPSS